MQGICALHEPSNLDSLVWGHGEKAGQVPVAANSPNLSTVAFIGPGPGPGQGEVLYVGASFTHPYYRDTFPAVATRNLAGRNALQLVDEGDVTGRYHSTASSASFRELKALCAQGRPWIYEQSIARTSASTT